MNDTRDMPAEAPDLKTTKSIELRLVETPGPKAEAKVETKQSVFEEADDLWDNLPV